MSDILDAVREAGYQEGIEEGKADAKRKVALKMIADGKSNSAINHLTDLTDQEINDLRNGGEQMI